MHNFSKLTTAAVVGLSAAAAQADVAFDANLELDTTYTNQVSAPATNARASDLTLGGARRSFLRCSRCQ